MVKVLGFLAIAMVGSRAFGDLIYLTQVRSAMASATIGTNTQSQSFSAPDFADFSQLPTVANNSPLEGALGEASHVSTLHADRLHVACTAWSGTSSSSLASADAETRFFVTFTVDQTADYLYTSHVQALGGEEVMGYISTADSRSELSAIGVDIASSVHDGPTGPDIQDVMETVKLHAGQQYALFASSNATVIIGGRVPGTGFRSVTPQVVGEYTIDLVPVPEPSTLALAGLGLGVLVATALHGFQHATFQPT